MVLVIIILLLSTLLLLKQINRMLSESSVKFRSVILDSCALIDGRILEITKTGFLTKDIIVPEFIIKELQLLADGRDSHKRERARFGLEIVKRLQQEQGLNVYVDQTNVKAPTTDEKLVILAKKRDADLCTIDFNLNQVASISGVRVLNINELTHALRPVALPGEDLTIKVLQPGSSRDQGVGYMEDGTMIVVDGARKDIGKEIKVSIIRTHQTIAGKMLFAEKIKQ